MSGGPFGGGGAFGPPSQGGGGFGAPGGTPPSGGWPPGGGGFGPQGGFGQPPQGGGYGARPPSAHIDEKPALLLALATALFCCIPGGVIALLVVQQAKTAAVNGDELGARSKLRLSMMLSGGSMAITLVLLCLYFVLVFAANA